MATANSAFGKQIVAHRGEVSRHTHTPERKMTMSKLNLKLMSAGVFVGCALIALKVAWATAGVGISTMIVSGPTKLPEIDVKTKNETYGHEVKIKTKGSSDIWVVFNTTAPGGHTGWHSH